MAQSALAWLVKEWWRSRWWPSYEWPPCGNPWQVSGIMQVIAEPHQARGRIWRWEGASGWLPELLLAGNPPGQAMPAYAVSS